jgi:hypothetical protein
MASQSETPSPSAQEAKAGQPQVSSIARFSFVAGVLFFPGLYLLSIDIAVMALGGIAWSIGVIVLAFVARRQIRRSRGLLTGRAWANLALALGVIGFFSCMIFTPSLGTRSTTAIGISRARSETKVAVDHAVQFGQEQKVYPKSLEVLRKGLNINVPDTDPWGRPYVLADQLIRGAAPRPDDDVYIYSRGRFGKGTGAVGYSTIYGSF